MTNADFRLAHDALGQLLLTLADGSVHAGVVPVRAFPIAAPDEAISLLGQDGHELAWVPHLDALDETLRALLLADFAQREFVPVIERLLAVSTFATPSQWTVATDRGTTTFTLKSEEDIRRLRGNALLIADNHGVHYLVKDATRLGKHDRKLLDRFL